MNVNKKGEGGVGIFLAVVAALVLAWGGYSVYKDSEATTIEGIDVSGASIDLNSPI